MCGECDGGVEEVDWDLRSGRDEDGVHSMASTRHAGLSSCVNRRPSMELFQCIYSKRPAAISENRSD